MEYTAGIAALVRGKLVLMRTDGARWGGHCRLRASVFDGGQLNKVLGGYAQGSGVQIKL